MPKGWPFWVMMFEVERRQWFARWGAEERDGAKKAQADAMAIKQVGAVGSVDLVWEVEWLKLDRTGVLARYIVW